MTLTQKLGVIGFALALIVGASLLIVSHRVFGDVSLQMPGNVNSYGLYRHYNFFATTSPQVLGYGTSTANTTPNSQATSTNITTWFSNGQADNGTFNVAGAKQLTLFCGRGATSTNNGTTTCTFQVEADSSGPWLYLNQLNLAASTTIVAAVNVSGNGNNYSQLIVPAGTSTVAATTLSEGFALLRCIVNIAQDGTGFCSASANW